MAGNRGVHLLAQSDARIRAWRQQLHDFAHVGAHIERFRRQNHIKPLNDGRVLEKIIHNALHFAIRITSLKQSHAVVSFLLYLQPVATR